MNDSELTQEIIEGLHDVQDAVLEGEPPSSDPQSDYDYGFRDGIQHATSVVRSIVNE